MLDDLNQILCAGFPLLGHDLILEIVPVEAGEEPLGVDHPQLVQDVSPDPGGSGGREGLIKSSQVVKYLVPDSSLTLAVMTAKHA